MNYLQKRLLVSDISQVKYEKCEGLLVISDSQEVIDFCEKESIAVVGYENDETSGLSCSNIVMDIEQIDEEYFEKLYRRCKGIPWDIATTDRTYIREFAMEDIDSLFDLYAKPGMTDYMEDLFEYEAEKEYEENYIKYIYKMYEYGQWLIFDKKTDELIGRAGIESRETCQQGEAELGYAIASDRWHQGLAYEVCSTIIKLAREEYQLQALIARTDPSNIASQGLLKKLGFAQVDKMADGDLKYYLNLQTM